MTLSFFTAGTLIGDYLDMEDNTWKCNNCGHGETHHIDYYHNRISKLCDKKIGWIKGCDCETYVSINDVMITDLMKKEREEREKSIC